MNDRFLHNEADFADLVQVVAVDRELAPSLVEKDYWVAFCLGELARNGWRIHFKGGTSLSKGFQIIERFSEDLDLKLVPPSGASLPAAHNWRSEGVSAITARQRFFDSLLAQLAFPDCEVREQRRDSRERWIEVRVEYPPSSGRLPAPLKAGVLLEIGHARVTPSAGRSIDSWVMERARKSGFGHQDTCQPVLVDCVLPQVTLIEKLDAISRCFPNASRSAASFVRHYEDVAAIIRYLNAVDSWEWKKLNALYLEMRAANDVRLIDLQAEAFLLPPGPRKAELETAWRDAVSLHWGLRVDLQEVVALMRANLAPVLCPS